MAVVGEIVREFGGSERRFRLGYGQVVRIEGRAGSPPIAELAQQLAPLAAPKPDTVSGVQWIIAGGLGRARAADAREVLLQALIGGEYAQREGDARLLVQIYCDQRPFTEWAPIAFEVCLAWLMGNLDEPLETPAGEPDGEATTPTSPRRKRSTSEKSTRAASS